MAISNRTANWQGMNWITQLRRMQINLRDGFICQSCDYDFLNPPTDQPARRRELDHIIPHSQGGSNKSENLYLSCGGKGGCNCTRQDKPLEEWLGAEKAAEIIAQAQKPIGDRQTALNLIEARKAARNNKEA